MIELPVLEPPEKWSHSYSSINTFANICEYRYAAEKLTPFSANDNTRRGNQIHDFLEKWGALGFDPDRYEELLVDGFLPADELQRWTDRARPIVEQLRPVWTERWLRTDLEGCERGLVGKADLLSDNGPDGKDEPCLVDYKTVNSFRKVMTQVECDRSLQGRIYAFVTGVRRVAFIYLNPHHEATYVLSEYSQKQLDQTREFVEHTAQQIERRWETGHWRKCHPGGLCSPDWCSLFSTCYPS